MTPDILARVIDLARSPDMTLGLATVRPSQRRVESLGRTDTLEPRVMQALVALAERPGEVLARRELIELCWGGRIVGDDAITQCITKLRRVGAVHRAFTLEAVPRVGYRLTMVDAAAPRRPWRRPSAVTMMAILALVTACAGVGYGLWLLRPAPLAGLTVSTAVTVRAFSPRSSDPETAQFAAAATDEVSGRLTDSLIRLAPSSAKDRRFAIDGTVLREGDLLKVRPRLLDTGSGAVLWTSEFEAPVDRAGVLRNQLAWRLTAAVQMAQEDLAFPSRDLTPEGLALMIEGRDNVRQGSWRAPLAIEQVLRLAPLYARGHGEAAMALTAAAAATADGARAQALIRRARGEASLAVKLEPRDPFGLVAQSLTLGGRDWSARAGLLRRADSLAPPGTPSVATALFLLDTGRLREGLLMIQQMIPHAEGYPMAGGSLVSALFMTGDQRQALARSDEFLQIRPADISLLQAQMMMTLIAGDPDDAQRLLGRPGLFTPYIGPLGRTALDRVALARKSRTQADHAGAVAALVAAIQAHEMYPADGIRLLTALGAVDEAMTRAEAYAADPRTVRAVNFFEPRFLFAADTAPLRRDPRFVGVVERLGLADYWRKSGAWPDFCDREPASVCAAIRRSA